MPKPLVINGHGSKTNYSFELGNLTLITPDSLNQDYTLNISPDWNVEKELLTQDSLKPLDNGAWQSYRNEKIPDVDLGPFRGADELTHFAERIKQDGLWSDIDGGKPRYLERDSEALLVIRNPDGGFVFKGPQDAQDIFNRITSNTYDAATEGDPIFLLAPKVGKVKLLQATTLSEVMLNLEEIAKRQKLDLENVTLLSCNTVDESKAKQITYQHESATNIPLSKITVADFEILDPTSNILQGPRVKGSATREIESLIKSILSGAVYRHRWNSFNEFEININNRVYNLTKILAHHPDFEQLNLNYKEVTSYISFITTSEAKTSLWSGQAIPSEADLAHTDQTSSKHLLYAEKLAHRLYTTQSYVDINSFFRNDAKRIPGQKEIKNPIEILLTAAIQTQAIVKAPDEAKKLNTTVEELVRYERPSAIVTARKQDMQQNKLSTQAAFTSTSEKGIKSDHPDINKITMHIQQPNSINPIIAPIKAYSVYPDEGESAAPVGTQLKIYKYHREGKNEEFSAIPVRSIGEIGNELNPYSYSSTQMLIRTSYIQIYEQFAWMLSEVASHLTPENANLLTSNVDYIASVIREREVYSSEDRANMIFIFDTLLNYMNPLSSNDPAIQQSNSAPDLIAASKDILLFKNQIRLLDAIDNKDVAVIKETIDTEPDYALTILRNSIIDHDINAIEVFTTAGLDINLLNENGETPLLAAIRNKDIELVQTLLACGAAVTPTENNNFTPPLASIELSGISNTLSVADIEIIKLLLEHGADPTVLNADGDDILLSATMDPDKYVVLEILLSRHPLQDKTVNYYKDALTKIPEHLMQKLLVSAATNGHPNLITTLLDACQDHADRKKTFNINVNSVHINDDLQNGKTLLSLAAASGNIATLDSLFKSGAKYSGQEDGNTPLKMALASGHDHVVSHLLTGLYKEAVTFEARKLLAQAVQHNDVKTIETFKRAGIEKEKFLVTHSAVSAGGMFAHKKVPLVEPATPADQERPIPQKH